MDSKSTPESFVALDLPDYEPAFAAAIEQFWEDRAGQMARQRLKGLTDTGTRGSVRGGYASSRGPRRPPSGDHRRRALWPRSVAFRAMRSDDGLSIPCWRQVTRKSCSEAVQYSLFAPACAKLGLDDVDFRYGRCGRWRQAAIPPPFAFADIGRLWLREVRGRDGLSTRRHPNTADRHLAAPDTTQQRLRAMRSFALLLPAKRPTVQSAR